VKAAGPRVLPGGEAASAYLDFVLDEVVAPEGPGRLAVRTAQPGTEAACRSGVRPGSALKGLLP
jgi:hypothetical protein